MKAILLVLISVSLTISYINGAAVRTTGVSSPVYDEDFMRKLCAFLGATYVRSAKDPLCWYTWCHNGEPYHMQCPAGRAVSKHFYWSTDDPCTESDSNEQCLVGFLKNMHLENNNNDEEVFEKQEDPEVVVAAPKSKHREPVENSIPEGRVEDEYEYEGSYYGSPQDAGDARQAPLLDVSEHDFEPLPEMEPEMAGPMLKEVVIRKIEDNGHQENVYFPEQHRAHIVEAFIPQNPIPLYGGYRRYNGPFHYFPRKFYPAPTKEQPSDDSEVRSEMLEEAEEPVEKVVLSTTAEPHYLPPMARSARLVGSPIAMDDAQVPQGNVIQDSYERDYRSEDYNREYDYQPEYIYEGQHNPTTPETAMQEEATASHGEEADEDVKKDTEEQTKVVDQEEQLIEAAEAIIKKEDPIIYDYFKTHFVEEV